MHNPATFQKSFLALNYFTRLVSCIEMEPFHKTAVLNRIYLLADALLKYRTR